MHKLRWGNVRNQWMRNLVSGEGDVTILQKTSADQVAKGVVFFVECKNRR